MPRLAGRWTWDATPDGTVGQGKESELTLWLYGPPGVFASLFRRHCRSPSGATGTLQKHRY